MNLTELVLFITHLTCVYTLNCRINLLILFINVCIAVVKVQDPGVLGAVQTEQKDGPCPKEPTV